MSDEPKVNRKQRTQDLLADRERVESMLAAIGSGMSLRDWCVINDVIYSTVQLRLTTDAELKVLYEAARVRQAEAVLDEIKELEERLEGKEGLTPIDPKAAAVLIGSKQWRAERLNPKRYGQRSYQEIETVDKTRLHIEALKQIGERRRRREVDVTPRPAQLPSGVKAQDVVDAVVLEQQPARARTL